MITNKKLNKKLDLLLARQTLMMEVLVKIGLNDYVRKSIVKKWNGLWGDIIEGRYKIVEEENGKRK